MDAFEGSGVDAGCHRPVPNGLCMQKRSRAFGVLAPVGHHGRQSEECSFVDIASGSRASEPTNAAATAQPLPQNRPVGLSIGKRHCEQSTHVASATSHVTSGSAEVHAEGGAQADAGALEGDSEHAEAGVESGAAEGGMGAGQPLAPSNTSDAKIAGSLSSGWGIQ